MNQVTFEGFSASPAAASSLKVWTAQCFAVSLLLPIVTCSFYFCYSRGSLLLVLRHSTVMDSKTQMEKRTLTERDCLVLESFCMTQSSGRVQLLNPSERATAASGSGSDIEACTEERKASRAKSSLLMLSLHAPPPFHLRTQLPPGGETRVGVSLQVQLVQNTNKCGRQEHSNGHVLRAWWRELIIKVKFRRKVGRMCGIPLPPADSFKPCVSDLRP